MSAFGGFGTSTNTQQPGQSGGLFGGLGSNTSGFGSTAQNTQAGSAFGAKPATGGSAFGGGLFGSTTSQGAAQPSGSGGGAFGGGGGVFGGASAGQQQQSGLGGGLFGGASTATQQQPATGGLFGGASTQQPQQQQLQGGGGLFGGGTTQQSNTGGLGGGLFGSTNPQIPIQQGQQPATAGGLFGASTNQPSGTSAGGLFGSSASTSTAAPGGGLFGASQQLSSAGQSSGLFGGLGQTQQQQQPSSGLFGTTPTGQQPQSSGLLGASTLGGGQLFASRAAAAPTQQQVDAQTQFTQLSQRIEAIVDAWNPNSPSNRFQHYLYNLVDPAQVHLYGRPANATDEALWQRAVRENPDPSCLVPVLATSFDDLQKRVEAQAQQATAHQERLKEIRSRIEKLSERHELSNAARLNKAASAQAQLTHRLLKLVQHLHLLIPALRSSSIRPEEEALRAVLEEMDSEIRRPGGMGRIVGKLNELWALVGSLQALRSGNARGSQDGIEWTVVDGDGLNQIVQILAEQQAGLAHLTKILKKDLRDTAVIYGEREVEDDERGRSDLLSSFSQTLRGSTLR